MIIFMIFFFQECEYLDLMKKMARMKNHNNKIKIQKTLKKAATVNKQTVMKKKATKTMMKRTREAQVQTITNRKMMRKNQI